MPESFQEHIKLMWDLQVLAFQADITRVSTLMYAHDVSMRSYPESGVGSAEPRRLASRRRSQARSRIGPRSTVSTSSACRTS